MSRPPPGPAGAGGAADDPGRTMGVVGLILSILGCTAMAGLSIGIPLSDALAQCAELGPGTNQVDGRRYACG